MLVINHDIYYKNTSQVNSLTELLGNRHNNIHIYEDTTEVEFDVFYLYYQVHGLILQMNCEVIII